MKETPKAMADCSLCPSLLIREFEVATICSLLPLGKKERGNLFYMQ